MASVLKFKVVLTDSDDDEDDLCSCIISLTQQDLRGKADNKNGVSLLSIGSLFIDKISIDFLLVFGPKPYFPFSTQKHHCFVFPINL
jgi:hypothetical protein